MMGGAMLVQWPAGHVSDRMDRRVVIAALAGVSAVAGLALAVTPAAAPDMLIYSIAFIWGAGALSFYGVAVAHAADRAPHGQQTPMMAGVLLAWAAGSTAGPVVAGLFMQVGLGPSGLFIYAAVAYAALAAAMMSRRGARPLTEAEIDAKIPFAPIAATSTAAAELDPRADTPEDAEDAAPPPVADEFPQDD
jgi:MFS family permease